MEPLTAKQMREKYSCEECPEGSMCKDSLSKAINGHSIGLCPHCKESPFFECERQYQPLSYTCPYCQEEVVSFDVVLDYQI